MILEKIEGELLVMFGLTFLLQCFPLTTLLLPTNYHQHCTAAFGCSKKC